MSIILASSAIGLANPSIGKNPGQIVFDDKTGTSETFKVWNKGTGTLSYKVSVSVGSKYFKVTPTTGKSDGTGDTQTHTVTVDFNAVPHAATVTGRIKITNTSDVNSPQYIDLTAHDAIARHIKFISIEQGIDYIPGENDANGTCDGLGLAGDFDCDGFVSFSDFATFAEQWRQTGSDMRADIYPDYKDGVVDLNDLDVFCENWLKDGRIGETYDFRFAIETDSTVSTVNFTTPDGNTYPDSNADTSRHIAMSRNKENGIYHWRYQEWFYEANGLENYPDGKYTVKVTYTDNNSDQTIVGFGIPKKPGSIAKPTQRPEIIYPTMNDENAVSPLAFTWAKCSDANVNSIRLGFRNSRDSNMTEQDYSENAVKTNSFKLTPGRSFAELNFGHWYQVQNDNDVPIEVGKTSRSHIAFDITKGFGAFGTIKNHQLQVADCKGKIVTFTLTGGGKGVVEGDPNIQDDCSFAKITLTGTTNKSVLTITPQKGAKATIGSIESDGPIKTINAAGVNVTGDININGTAASIVLNDISGSSNISIIGSSDSPACSLKFGRVNKLALTSGMPIKKLRATEWKSGSVTAPWISSLATDGNTAIGVAGNFGADVNLSGQDRPKGISLNKAKITGELGDSKWNIVGDCGTIELASSSKNLDVNITGNVGTLRAIGNKKMNTVATLSGTWQVVSVKTIKATDISECNLAASYKSTGKAAAIGTIKAGRLMDSDFAAADGLLKQLSITGVVGEPFGVINSNVDANYIGSAYLAFPKYSNNGKSFGLTAGAIDKVTVKNPAKTTTWKKGSQISIESLTIEDFRIRLE